MPLTFYSSIMFVSNSIYFRTNYREQVGALLEISDKFITKLHVFSYKQV